MILYHGTDKTNLKGILAKGLLPRKETGKSVYQGKEASNKNFVYLTRFNPTSHAYTIDNLPVIIKVDVDPQDFYPDEDYIERMIYVSTGVNIPMCDIDVTKYKKLWQDSLHYFGCVAIHSVPKENIVAHVCLDPTDFNYHCGIGAQGNTHVKDLTKLRLDTESGKYIQRLEILFTDGWEACKKDILKEKPSSVLKLNPPHSKITYKGTSYDVLLFHSGTYVCDEWIDNIPERPNVPVKGAFLKKLAKESSKLLLIPAKEIDR